MPNGFYGSEETWQRIESPLRALDTVLEGYARQHGMSFGANYHNGPERSLRWGSPVRRLMQIYLEDERAPTYNFWLCASEDRGHQRYWKNAFLKRAVPVLDIQRNLQQLLEAGREQLEQWQSQDLVLAGPLGK